MTEVYTPFSLAPSPWIDVRTYGATGDGATDDTQAIQSALDAAGNGGTVFFSAGVYLISATLTILSGQGNLDNGPRLLGAGPAAAGVSGGGSVLAGTTAILRQKPGTVGPLLTLRRASIVEGLRFEGWAPGWPNMTVAAGGAGILSGTYRFAVTWTVGGVESGPSVSVPVAGLSVSNQQIQLTGIPVGPSGTTERRIYGDKKDATGAWQGLRLVAIIGDNVTTSYTITTDYADWGVTLSYPNNDGIEISRNHHLLRSVLVLWFGRDGIWLGGEEGISVNAFFNTLINVVCAQCGRDGFAVTENHNSFYGCLARDNGRNGFRAQAQQLALYSCRADGNDDYGIYAPGLDFLAVNAYTEANGIAGFRHEGGNPITVACQFSDGASDGSTASSRRLSLDGNVNKVRVADSLTQLPFLHRNPAGGAGNLAGYQWESVVGGVTYRGAIVQRQDDGVPNFSLRLYRPTTATPDGEQAMALDGAISLPVLTPPQITANQNNYAPGQAYLYRLSSDATRNITGLKLNNIDGKQVVLVNVGANDIVLVNESTASSAANRIHTGTGANITLGSGDAAILIYDATTSRWRVINVW